MKNELEIFVFMGKRVRVAMYDGEPWFIANDVGKVLGLSNIRELIRIVLEDGERLYVRKSDTQGIIGPKAVAINESGLYTVIMHSTRPEAKAFRRWVTGEVLPSLRRTGSYEMLKTREQTSFEEVLAVNDESPKVTVKMKISGELPEIARIFSNLAGYVVR